MDASVPEDKRPPTGYRGRFAPSPTGPLHFGSLVAAVGSYLQARSHGGLWQVRIEDIDPPRVVPGAAEDQLATLARFGMAPDGPVRYQRRSTPRHAAAVERLLADGLAFACGCSRADLPSSGVYPGTCRSGLPPGRTARSVRFRVPAEPVRVQDPLRGAWEERLEQTCGDVVIRRADGFHAYQLAAVVDDLHEGITEVVRGADLIDSAGRQQALHRALGGTPPRWLHLPLVVDSSGRKLSKSSGADPVTARPAAEALALALRVLGHPPPAGRRTLDALWAWARASWATGRIPTEPFEL
ncbi:tRNA glutamyl-Q(34) synthetase GluQRS [Wenzhouxiangella sp. XN79A]|uniref:tRNA glutamyl-Q(34) synthetase GluQRS n=1 Tax=Wenzhouxiangella sp. XN79A TaxID=2724193 RepID=UPI00144AF600|nr:tRNA glutamyl-Q(34) synthetase GluQRS [Wenzhouxiangella sp. XN79A]NKI36013.1 tRNA glutamyl-Q(34) synthetase GluQRS [Wenzhouxiangella sp. XN79A]